MGAEANTSPSDQHDALVYVPSEVAGNSQPSPSEIPSPIGLAQEGLTSAPTALRRRGLRKWVSDYGVFLVFVLIIVTFSVLLPNTFFSVGNFRTIISSQAVLLILALGLIVPLSVGEFDLSVGALLGLASMLLTWLTVNAHWNAGLAVIVTLGAGAAVGAINGFLVVKVGLNAFIATLGTMTALDGITLGISNGQIITGVPASITNPIAASWYGFSTPVFIALGMALVLWYVFDFTPLGKYLYFVGTGPETARLVGLRVDRMRWGAFLTSGIVSSLAGIGAAGQLGGAVTGVGDTYLLPAFAAAFLGATTIRPGRFNPWGTVVALYLLVTGVTGLELLGFQDWIGQVFDGVALIAAVAFSRLTAKQSNSREVAGQVAAEAKGGGDNT